MNVVCIGAHPDDCECFAGGTAVKWARKGHRVLFVSLTNGDIGHHETTGGALAQRRAAECRKSAELAGVDELVLGHHDGELEPTLEVRKEVVRIIRKRRADVVITHRPNDYHPDHRYTSVAVQDAAFLVTVPHFCPEVARLEWNPVFLYMVDEFTKPAPFEPDVAVDITDVMDVKWAMMAAMESQVFEWLPWLDGRLDSVPKAPEERLAWMKEAWAPFFKAHTALARPGLVAWYGKTRAEEIEYAEAFEICEYGTRPSRADLQRLFPFLPARRR
ncbi:MAG: PIG-L family deacetylase [Candidatus Hydrogenedentes bacterium]|nr:PIG-L family deacetylase [Candidatus Hydrogenedentota bacterium]